MNTTSLHIKIDRTTKAQAQNIADELGISLSSVVKAFLKQFIRTRKLSVDLPEQPTKYFKKLMKEADADVRDGKVVSFKTGKDALDYLDAN